VAGFVAQASGAAPAMNRTFEAFLPKMGLELAWTDDVKSAFTLQRGYRSGGSSTNTARSTAFPFNPEFTWNYELSLRSAWLDGALTLNANAFYVDWQDQQVSVNFGLNLYDFHTVNAGKSHLYGFELEAVHRVSSKFDWYASVGHTRTEFDEFTVNLGDVTDLAGLEFPYAPHWTLAGGFNVRLMENLHLNMNASYRGSVYADTVVPQSDARIKPCTLVNARLAYEADHLDISGFVSNLFDEEYAQFAVSGFPQAVLGNPRIVGLAVGTSW
jgi:outer membrane receptor protein involved in Fe transport